MIRSLTIGLPLVDESQSTIERGVSEIISVAEKIFKEREIKPRTIRYSLPPIGSEGEKEGYLNSILNWVDSLSEKTGVRWFCLPLDLISESPRNERLGVSLDAIAKFPKMFLNLMVADQNRLSVGAINDSAHVISQISQRSNSGFDNFRVGASCGCPPHSPFFPFSHHNGSGLAFSFALELTDKALNVLDQIGTNAKVDYFRELLVMEFTEILLDINDLGNEIASKSNTKFNGVDASLAPFPNGKTSVAAIIEKLIGAPIGSQGSVFATGLLTDSIRSALIKSKVPSVGFNGVMFSLLEDNALASANSRRHLALDSLISLSSMCGCGIDMVPVPGSSFPEEIAALTMDMAGMSLALKKPLGVRVLPIPGGLANEHTKFNYDFLCDSRIVSLSSNERYMNFESDSFSPLAPPRL